MLKRFFIVLAAASFLFMLFGCGEVAPEGSVITIYPDTAAVSDSNVDLNITDYFFRIVVTKKDVNEKVFPVNDAEIWISCSKAIPNPSGLIQLTDGNTTMDSPMSVTTDKDGVYNLRFFYQSGEGLEYDALIEVSSGSAYGSALFSVKAD